MTSSNLSYDTQGSGPAALVLHGGGGPDTVALIAAHLATDHFVITPTLPGWNGTERPDSFTSVSDLAHAYLGLLGELGLSDVLVIGSSLGGWIAADMASLDTAGLIGKLVIIDGAGIVVPSEPMPDFFSFSPQQIAEHSWHEPEKFLLDPSTLPPEAIAAHLKNMESMGVYAGDPYMNDPSLPERLTGITAKALLVWGASDRVFTPGYGRAYSELIPGSRFQIIEKAGHLPHLEQPKATLDAIDAFLATH